MNPDNSEKSFFTMNVIGALILGLIIGFIIGAYYTRHESAGVNQNPGGVMETASSTPESLATSTTATNLYGDMAGHPEAENAKATVLNVRAGNNVILDNLVIGSSYWVAVRDNPEGAKLPYILGARRMQAGSYTNVSIALSRNTVSGKKYDIVLYKPVGGYFNYDFSNLAKVNGTNSPALTTFTAQ